jgi:hypothetical protein
MVAPAFRAKLHIFLGVIAAIAVSRGAAQTPRQQPSAGRGSIVGQARGLIVGQVIDAVTGKPLRDAIVSITTDSQALAPKALRRYRS